MVKRLIAVIVLFFLLGVALAYIGVVDSAGSAFWWLMALSLPLLVAHYFVSEGYFGPHQVLVPVIAVYILFGGIAWQYYSSSFPFTSQQMVQGKIEADVKTADALESKTGPGIHILAREDREESKAKVTKWTADRLRGLEDQFNKKEITYQQWVDLKADTYRHNTALLAEIDAKLRVPDTDDGLAARSTFNIWKDRIAGFASEPENLIAVIFVGTLFLLAFSSTGTAKK